MVVDAPFKLTSIFSPFSRFHPLQHMRILAREQFIIRATVKKIVKQIGLTEPESLRD